MKKIVIAITVVMLLTGCSSGDTPKFADGEAIAIVKQKVNNDEIEQLRWSIDKIYSNDARNLDNFSFKKIREMHGLCSETADILRKYHDAFEESYLGDGIWSVSIPTLTDADLNFSNVIAPNAELENIVASWKVYEASGTVEFTGEYTNTVTGIVVKPFRLCPKGAGG